MRLRISPPRVHLDIFTFAVLWNATLASTSPPHETCIIIYCFSLWEGREGEWVGGKDCYCYFLLEAHSDIQFSRHSGYTFICTVITSPCPPTTRQWEKVHKTFFLFPFPPSTYFLLFVIYLRVLIASNRRTGAK